MGRPLRAATHPLDVAHLGVVDYRDAWDRQRDLATRRADGAADDTLLLLEHPAVYTAGRRTRPEDLPADGTDVVDTDRGGRITWHGPGQLVGYPIVALGDPIDVVAYVRALESALMAVCARWGVTTTRVEGRSGVWVPGAPARKIAAIGVRVARGVTLHGFSLNCDCDLGAFGAIVPCGIADAGVTSLTAELGRPVRVADVSDAVAQAVAHALDAGAERADAAVAAGVTSTW